MKIYFGGAIRGGRSYKGIYLEMINHLKKYGQVLTEHVGDQKLTSRGETKLTDEEIKKRDMARVEECDVFIGEVSVASWGMGYEARRAEELGKKIMHLVDEKRSERASALCNGNPNMNLKEYQTIDDARRLIDEFFEKLNI